jgi:hypothetical protein
LGAISFGHLFAYFISLWTFIKFGTKDSYKGLLHETIFGPYQLNVTPSLHEAQIKFHHSFKTRPTANKIDTQHKILVSL